MITAYRDKRWETLSLSVFRAPLHQRSCREIFNSKPEGRTPGYLWELLVSWNLRRGARKRNQTQPNQENLDRLEVVLYELEGTDPASWKASDGCSSFLGIRPRTPGSLTGRLVAQNRSDKGPLWKSWSEEKAIQEQLASYCNVVRPWRRQCTHQESPPSVGWKISWGPGELAWDYSSVIWKSKSEVAKLQSSQAAHSLGKILCGWMLFPSPSGRKRNKSGSKQRDANDSQQRLTEEQSATRRSWKKN